MQQHRGTMASLLYEHGNPQLKESVNTKIRTNRENL